MCNRITSVNHTNRSCEVYAPVWHVETPEIFSRCTVNNCMCGWISVISYGKWSINLVPSEPRATLFNDEQLRLPPADEYTASTLRLHGATENARLELSAPNCRGGKCRTSSYGKPKHLRDWKCRSYFLLVTAHTKQISNYLSDCTK